MSSYSNQSSQRGGNGGRPNGGGPRGQRGNDRSEARRADFRGDDVRRDDQGRQRNRRRQHERPFSAQAPGRRRRAADPARLTAFEALRAVNGDDAYGNLVLPNLVRKNHLDKRDAAFATELAYGAMRRQGTWDAVLEHCVDRPLNQLDPAVLDALRLGTHQLLAMRVPDHAALDATVGLVRGEIGQGPAGLVNAVLRKVAAHDLDGWLARLEADQSDELRVLSVRHAHPLWQVRAFRRALRAAGRSPEELETLLEADNEPPRVHLVELPGIGSLSGALAEGATPGNLVSGSAESAGGAVHRIPGTQDGSVRVQDAGSQLVARVLTAAPVKDDQGRWADLCAGPGGKAALLAALAAQQDANLLANEVSMHRTNLVRAALAPVPESAWQIRTGDGRDLDREFSDTFDRVLVDVPCTGLGALRRRPEARWRRTPSDIGDLAPLQRELLATALEVVRPGGVVVYATCSPHTAETLEVVQDVVDSHKNVQILDTAAIARDAALPGAFEGSRDAARAWDNGGTSVQLWPHVHGTDAMFMIALRRTT